MGLSARQNRVRARAGTPPLPADINKRWTRQQSAVLEADFNTIKGQVPLDLEPLALKYKRTVGGVLRQLVKMGLLDKDGDLPKPNVRS